MRRAAALLVACALASVDAAAHPCKFKPIVLRADGPARPWPVAAEAESVRAAGGFRKSNGVPPGQSARHGIAEILVPVEPAVLLASLQRYADYKDFAPNKFKTSRVLGIDKTGKTDVYMQIAILRGAITLWQTMRFDPVRVEPGSDLRVIEGRFVDGNLAGSHVRVVVAGAGEGHAYARLELLVELPMFAPQSAIDEELRDAAGDALRGVAKRFASP